VGCEVCALCGELQMRLACELVHVLLRSAWVDTGAGSTWCGRVIVVHV